MIIPLERPIRVTWPSGLVEHIVEIDVDEGLRRMTAFAADHRVIDCSSTQAEPSLSWGHVRGCECPECKGDTRFADGIVLEAPGEDFTYVLAHRGSWVLHTDGRNEPIILGPATSSTLAENRMEGWRVRKPRVGPGGCWPSAPRRWAHERLRHDPFVGRHRHLRMVPRRPAGHPRRRRVLPACPAAA